MAFTRNEKFPFLNERLSREPHIEEILTEIDFLQKNWIKNKAGELATAAYLNESRNVKLPLTQKRLMNIEFLLNELVKHHPDEVKPVYSFLFSVEPESKKLNIEEKVEYTLLMDEGDYHALQYARDSISTRSLLELLKTFRLFNLTKLIKKAKNRNHLSQLIKQQIGKTIFTFKNYSLDKSGVEIVEDYCFHKDNYEAVKNRLDVEKLKDIIDLHSLAINRRLKNLGILNSYISDYRDSKIDYILNILTVELATSLDRKDILEVKNFQSLRDCINKVERILDPVVMLDGDISEYIKNNFFITDREILSMFRDLTGESLNRWLSEKISTGRIVTFSLPDGTLYLFDSTQFMSKYEEVVHLILHNPHFKFMEDKQKEEMFFKADLLTDVGKKITSSPELSRKILTGDSAMHFKKLMSEYEAFKFAQEELDEYFETAEQKTSFFSSIIYAVASLFKKKEKVKNKGKQATGKKIYKSRMKKISKESQDIYKLIADKKSPLIPLSDFIELKPENEPKIDTIIRDLRGNDLKIVIPIYNARQVLYPIRSKKYLMSDVEYLLVDPEVAKTPESIREFIDNITGYKFKEDTISGNALFSIEKYLFSIHRQNRAKNLKNQK
ncbi:MAG TPA: hypothetical protein PKX79_00885 [Spirochaetota bacterium]|nr:hypothetical protein [Spirochaetota bacterium]HOK92753.1 hypothetical protein [Spirochaetota bacterium]HON15783.1 hypothetical protein [Spirochaetota bacterium]HPP93916.1 hypothetical protein [Spirochaetota bacterium]HRS62497.1 hypothetical protein [Spirochaetota bacterium]